MSRGAGHGDDFFVVAGRVALDHLGNILASKYSVRESHRLGFGRHCVRHAQILNRIVSLGVDESGQRFVKIEPDARHAELVLRELGFTGKKVNTLTIPGF